MFNQRFLLQLLLYPVCLVVTMVVTTVVTTRPANAITRNDESSITLAQLTQVKWQQDVDKLLVKIKKLHPKPWRTLSEKQFKSHLQRIVGTSAHDSRNKTTTKLMQAVALISKAGQDGQSKISPFQKAVDFQLLPIRVVSFVDGVYIVDASDKYKRLIGNRITTMSGKSIETILLKMKSLINNENVHWQNKQAPLYALMPELLEVLEISQGQSIALNMINSKGRLDKSVLRAVSVNQYKQLFQGAIPFNVSPLTSKVAINTSYKNHFQKQLEKSTLYTQINRVTDEENFIDFIEKVAIEIKKYQLGSLIIDLRNNSGATVTDYSALMEMLDGFKNSRRELDIYVLTSHDTFSSAVFLAIELKDKHSAVLIGEETGGSPDQFLETEEFLLPNSKLLVNVATRFWKKSATNKMILTLKPDYLVRPTSMDYFSNNDGILNKTLELIELRSFD